MFHPSVATAYVLTDTEKADIEEIVRSTVPPYRPEAYEEFMAGCRKAANELPSSIHRWRDQVKTADLGVIHNLPVDAPLPATPTVRYGADSISMLADSVSGTISALFGTIYTVQGKGMGRHISNMYPVIGDEYTQLGSSSKVDLAWHVEEAFHPARPVWFSLLCLRGDAKATTKIARARDLRLPPDILSTLREFRFKLRIDETYGDHSPSTYITTSVLSGPMSDPEIVLDPAYTVFQDEIEQTAVAAVESAAEQVHQPFTLMEGDLLVFNNRRTIHARSPFYPRMDGTDRWLKRTYILEASAWISKLSNGVIPFEID